MNKTVSLKRREQAFFILYLFIFAAVTMVIALIQPMEDNSPLFSNPPDEHSRILIPEFIAKYGHLPTGLEDEIIIGGYGISYGLTPYLPYVIMGYLMRFVLLFTNSEIAIIYTGRFVNIIFGTIMAAVVYFISKRLFKKKQYAYMFSIAIMFMPQHLFMHSYINTESMCYMGIAVLLYGLISIYQDKVNYKNSFILAIGIVIVASTYYNAYGYLISAFVLFLAYFVSKENQKSRIKLDYKNMLKYGLFILVIVLVLAGWWFIRNMIIHDGDLFGMRTQNEMYLAVNPDGRPSYYNKGYSLFEMFSMNPDYFDKLFKSFFAGYGSAAMFCNDYYYLVYKFFYGIGILFSLIHAVYFFYKNKIKKEIEYRISIKRYFFHINMIYCILMPIALHLYYVYAVDYQPQGRYLFSMLIPLIYYIVKGYEWFGEMINKHGNVLMQKAYTFVPYLSYAWIALALVWMVSKVALPVYLSDPLWDHTGLFITRIYCQL